MPELEVPLAAAGAALLDLSLRAPLDPALKSVGVFWGSTLPTVLQVMAMPAARRLVNIRHECVISI